MWLGLYFLPFILATLLSYSSDLDSGLHSSDSDSDSELFCFLFFIYIPSLSPRLSLLPFIFPILAKKKKYKKKKIHVLSILTSRQSPTKMDPRATDAGAHDLTALQTLIRISTNTYIAGVRARMKDVKTDDLVDL